LTVAGFGWDFWRIADRQAVGVRGLDGPPAVAGEPPHPRHQATGTEGPQRPLDGADALSAVSRQGGVRRVTAAVHTKPLEQGEADIGFAVRDPPGAAVQLDAGFPDGTAFAAHRHARAVAE